MKNEEHYITKRCPKDKSFKDWIVDDIRERIAAYIETYTFDDDEEFLAELKKFSNNKNQ